MQNILPNYNIFYVLYEKLIKRIKFNFTNAKPKKLSKGLIWESAGYRWPNYLFGIFQK
jgi:hypothetical protein